MILHVYCGRESDRHIQPFSGCDEQQADVYEENERQESIMRLRDRSTVAALLTGHVSCVSRSEIEERGW